MAKRETKTTVEFTKEQIQQALYGTGWPVPDPSSPEAPQTSFDESGARWTFSWTETTDVPDPV